MAQIYKEKALEVLNCHIEQAHTIEQTLNATGSIYEQYTFDLTRLRTDTTASLIHIFGEHSRQLDTIAAIPTVAYSTHGQQIILKLFRAALSAMVDEIREYWDDQIPADMTNAIQEAASASKTSNLPVNHNRGDLFWNLTAYFDMSEIEALCFELGIMFDNIRDEGKTSKAYKLIMYCERNGRTGELIAACQKLRPNVSWVS